ncbi:MAG: FAD-dependent monooxygenase [Burkholderiaceae bacterium]|nr:FAD-dependent monooxygenase [Burkholderiaceae bacterium]
MQHEEAVDVAVVGAGVVGLAVALACAQMGLSVTLIGPATRSHRAAEADVFDARIYALSPASVGLLQQLRVWAQVDAARVQPVARMRVFGDTGAELKFDAYSAAVERLATIVEEAELIRVLAAACAYTPRLQRVEAEFSGYALAENSIRVVFGRSALRAQLLVGADGARSAVRAAAGIPAEEFAYGQTAVVANFAAQRPHDGTAFQWFTDEGVVALLPLPDLAGGAAVSLVWSAPHPIARALLALTPQELALRVGQRCGMRLGTLAPLGPVHSFPLIRLTAARLIAPRVALVGDAAHVIHPLAGQGLNLGLGDVSTLAAVLSQRESFREIGDPVLLRRYERARAEPVALMRATTDALVRLFSADNPLLRLARNAGLLVVDSLLPLKRTLILHAIGDRVSFAR